MGRDLEKIVLARAVWHQLNHSVLVHENRTVVFD
jgi:formyltetrahydrofolate deformylase